MDKQWKSSGSPGGSSADPNNSWEPVLFGNHGCRLPETLRFQQSAEDVHLLSEVCYRLLRETNKGQTKRKEA